jgi:PEP-CTERM motif
MKRLGTLIAVCCLLALAVPAGASVVGGSVSTGGTFVKLSVPWGSVTSPANTVGNDNFGTNNLNLYAFDEVQNYTLTAPLVTDIGTNPIPTGTIISSQFVTFEPSSSVNENLIGNVTFSTKVLAIITQQGTLIASNFLGAPGITYLDPSAVGLETGDSVTISGLYTIHWDTFATSPGDSVRVITAATPEPGTMIMFGSGIIGLAGLLRRKINL